MTSNLIGLNESGSTRHSREVLCRNFVVLGTDLPASPCGNGLKGLFSFKHQLLYAVRSCIRSSGIN